jgi:hypothetical protein
MQVIQVSNIPVQVALQQPDIYLLIKGNALALKWLICPCVSLTNYVAIMIPDAAGAILEYPATNLTINCNSKSNLTPNHGNINFTHH